jgi:hypothetical protein
VVDGVAAAGDGVASASFVAAVVAAAVAVAAAASSLAELAELAFVPPLLQIVAAGLRRS